MRMKQWVPILFMAMIFLLWKPMDADACSCMMPPPPEDAINEADAVFTGEVVEVIENGKITMGYGKTVHFKVDEAWKGTTNSEIVITTGNNDGDCGIPFEKGQKYLVYATNSDMYVKGTLSTTICHRTTQLASATEDLNALGEGQEINEAHTDDRESLLWWAAAIFIFCLLAIIMMYKVKNDKNKTRS